LLALCLPVPLAAEAEPPASTLEEALAQVKIPPAWLESVPFHYPTNKPWKEARLHIRKLLAEGGEKAREAIKLTYLYIVVNKVPPDDHEYPLNLYLAGEYAWATKIYAQRLESFPKGHSHEYSNLASLYMHFGEPRKALQTLNAGLQRLPDPPWDIMNKAKLNDAIGDIYAKLGEREKATKHYQLAIKLYPTSKQPWGRHLLPRHAAKTQAKLDLLLRDTFDLAEIPDGVYRGKSLGYGKDVHAVVTMKGGRIAQIRVSHQEKIEQGATKTIPKRIIEKQTLEVDGVTGATVTTQAIIEATYRALQSAGLK